ncbi:hypothetical protein [Pseudonocardia sp. NPDC049635]|uniref:GREB1-related protein n=1 Tax=Pseudonocardia sp. NPDC049635 TaxID=3155506 RepID=UPI0033F99B9E
MVAVISGGRPELRQRPVRRYLPDVDAIGVHSTCWVVSDTDAPSYEDDDHPLAVYPRAWAEEYAATHWMLPQPPEPGAFLGAFPGREWACREAERRGCWAVLQLDDNIDWLCFLRGTGYSKHFVNDHGGLGLFLDLLAGVALSTNARTVGAQLDAVNPGRKNHKIARPGFPYSLFLERVGPGREEWYGPFEDDITHSFQYGTRADGATAAVMPLLHYKKESKSKTGMRAHYNHTRAVQLQRIFPESAKINVRATRSNGRGDPRVFHTMLPGAIRNPLAVHDRDRFQKIGARLTELADQWHAGELAANRDKVNRRARAAAGSNP